MDESKPDTAPSTPDTMAESDARPTPNTKTTDVKKSPNLLIVFILSIAILGVIFAAMMLLFGNNSQENPDNPTPNPTPVLPRDDPKQTSFIVEGKAFIHVDDHSSILELSDSFIAHSWDDITNYFAPAIEAYANERYQTPDIDGDLAKVKEDFDFSQGPYAIVRHSDGGCSYSVMNVGVTSIEDGTVNILFEIDDHCGLCAQSFV